MSHTSSSFETLYKKLNQAQKQAVDAIEGPVMVVAGPGTGKTQILTLRIANILRQTDTPPDAILALTFTESAVAAVRRRLVSIVGSAGYRVRIHTFHNFCNEIIKRWPDEFPRIIGAEPITDIDRIGILREIIAEGHFEHLKPLGDPFYYIPSLRGKIGELKRENVTPDKLAVMLERDKEQFESREDLYHAKGAHTGKMKGVYQTEAKKRERSFELLTVYRAYEMVLAEQRRYDFEDMIVEAVAALERNEDLRLRVQEETIYLLADEHQDANTAQNRLLELLSSYHEHPNIFVVGDEKQAIFRFQGASLDNFLYFKKLYPDALLVTLTEGYRSGQKILDAAHSLIMNEPGADAALRVPLISRAGVTGEHIALRNFANGDIERAWLAGEIGRLIGEGVEASEIAILYRTNRESDALAHALESRGLTVAIESDQNALTDPDIRKLIMVLRAIAYFGNDESMAAALHAPFLGIAPLDLYKMIRATYHDHVLIADVMRSKERLIEAGVENVPHILDMYARMERWASSHESPLVVLDEIIRDSGFLAYALKSDRSVELLEKLGGVVRDAEELAAGRPDYSLQGLMAHLQLLEEYAIPVRKVARMIPREGAVRLMTAHASKGLEFDYVFMTGVVDGSWGGRISRESFAIDLGGARGNDDDERRLFYVALTRARLGVTISYARENATGKAQLPSRFVEEIDPSIVEVMESTEEEKQIREQLLTRSIPAHRPGVLASDKQYLNELFVRQGLSVTALNNYLVCPWRYFYSSLVRIPQTPAAPMLFGTAVHRTLNKHFALRAHEIEQTTEEFLSSFDDQLARLPLSARDIEHMSTKHRENLGTWFAARSPLWGSSALSEYTVGVNLSLAHGTLNEISLRGDLDRVEFLDEQRVHVVDFKTGKPKSRNALVGATKSDDGGYFRQLVFYALLLKEEGKYHMETGAIDFVQPGDNGKIREPEYFGVTEVDMEELVGEIGRVAHEIMELSFWDTRCEDHACQYCMLRDTLFEK